MADLKLNDIKLIGIDVDGTLTDGIYIMRDGFDSIISKSFYTRDFYGIEKVLKKGIHVVIISQSHDSVINNQINRICGHSDFWESCCKTGLLSIFCAVNDKLEKIQEIINEKGLLWENVAYIGDAENDLPVMRKAGFTACPTDAIWEVVQESNYPSDFYGGKGAVHDVCKYILSNFTREKNNANIEP